MFGEHMHHSYVDVQPGQEFYAQDTTQADAILKNYYLPVVREMVNQKAILLFGYSPEETSRGLGSMNAARGETMDFNGISRDAEKVEFAGRQWVFVAHTKRNESGTMRDEGGVLPTPGEQGWEDFADKVRRAYKQVQISGFALAVSERSLGSYLRLLETETSGAINDLRKDLNRQGYGDQTGALSAISAAGGGANTFDVDNLQYYRVGMYIDLVNKSTDAVLATNRKVTNIATATRRITYDGADVTASIVAGTHVPCMTGNWEKEINGLRNMIRSDVYPILHGVDASSAANYFWRGKFKDGGNTTLDEDQGQLLLDEVAAEVGEESGVIITTRGIRRRYANTLKAQKRFNDANALRLHGGFKYIDFNGMPLLADDDCPKQHAFFLNTDDFLWVWLQSQDFQWMQRDGAVLRKVESPDLDAYKATLYKYMDFGILDRKNQGVIYNLADDIP